MGKPPAWRIHVLILVLPVPLALLTAALQPPPVEIREPVDGVVGVSEAATWETEPLWIDARSTSAYQAGHIPGATLLNESDWSALVPGVLRHWRPGRPVVVYCGDAGCQASEAVARRLRELGIEPVYVLEGGWDSWKRERR